IAKLAIGETPLGALAARRSLAAVEFRTISSFELRTVASFELRAVATLKFGTVASRLEIPLLAALTIIAGEPPPTRPGAIVAPRLIIIATAAWRAAIAAKVALLAITLVEAALGEFLLRPPGSTGAALAPGGPVTPAAGIVVFVLVAGHERSHSGAKSKGMRA